MRQWFRTALAGVLLTGTLAVSAAAADYTACADHLKELGLLQGTQAGYELDRTPTRSEAAAMLVRLLGEEQSALTLEYTAPFTDLQNWEKPYVQYLYDNDLTTGTSANEFSPEETCTAQMYAAFLLRALGYTEDAGDFSYTDATSFAQHIGLYDQAVVDQTEFARDDVVAASYTALALMPKNSTQTLLDQLVENGAVDAQIAQPYQELFRNYAEYREDTAGMQDLQHFSVISSYLSPVTFRKGIQGELLFALQVSDTTTFDREANAVLTDSMRTLSAAGVADKTVSGQTYLADGKMQRRVDGGWYTETVSVQEQAQLMAAYMPVSIVWVQDMTRSQADNWMVSFAQLPPIYRGWMQPVESAIGSLDEAEVYTVVVKQNTNGGRIVSQGLTVELEVDGIYACPILVSKLDRTGDEARLMPPV